MQRGVTQDLGAYATPLIDRATYYKGKKHTHLKKYGGAQMEVARDMQDLLAVS